jgi:hypothetical protein
MRLLSIIFFLFLAVLFSCTKSTPLVLPSFSGYFEHWRWVRTDWSFIFKEGVIYPTADSIIFLNLNADSTYSFELNGNIASSGTFQIDSLKPSPSVEINMTQTTPASKSLSLYVWIKSDTMWLTSFPTPDGLISTAYVPK